MPADADRYAYHEYVRYHHPDRHHVNRRILQTHQLLAPIDPQRTVHSLRTTVCRPFIDALFVRVVVVAVVHLGYQHSTDDGSDNEYHQENGPSDRFRLRLLLLHLHIATVTGFCDQTVPFADFGLGGESQSFEVFEEVVVELLFAEGTAGIFFEDELATLVAEGVVAGADVEVGVELGFAELAEGFGCVKAHGCRIQI